MKKFKSWCMTAIIVTSLLAIIAGGIAWDRYRWHTFQEVTDSDIGYWKWKFVIDNSDSSKR